MAACGARSENVHRRENTSGSTCIPPPAITTARRRLVLLHCTILYCIILYRIVPYCTVLYRIVPYCTVHGLDNVPTPSSSPVQSILQPSIRAEDRSSPTNLANQITSSATSSNRDTRSSATLPIPASCPRPVLHHRAACLPVCQESWPCDWEEGVHPASCKRRNRTNHTFERCTPDVVSAQSGQHAHAVGDHHRSQANNGWRGRCSQRNAADHPSACVLLAAGFEQQSETTTSA